MIRNSIHRRDFLRLSALGLGAALLRPASLFTKQVKNKPGDVRFGMSSDVHLRYQPADFGCPAENVNTPEQRWSAFFKAASDWDADVVIDLGDSQPKTFDSGPGKAGLEVWNAWPKEKIAVYGNHDNDYMPKEDYLKAMGMPAPYYTRQIKNWTFIVLDTGELRVPPEVNESDWGFGAEGNDWGREQLAWLKEQIEKAPGYCVVLSHFCVRHGSTPLPTEPFRQLIKQANDKAGYTKLVACFYGHRHIPRIDTIDGVSYIGMNSMNYRYIHPKKWLFYRDPAPWAMGVFTEDGKILMEGTGIPNNWAVDCEKAPIENPPDDLTYQINIPKP